MRHLIIGAGEVGRSLAKVLQGVHDTVIRDMEDLDVPDVGVMHICLPGGLKNFEEIVRNYRAAYNPKYTVIHSTVPPGTSRRLGAIHSPIHGKHPDLEGGIRTFVKYVGGADMDAVKVIAFELLSAGIPVRMVDNPETSEASKILCTSYYGMAITYVKDAKAFCERVGANFEQAYGWNKHYNAGYTALGMGQFVRPVLSATPGPIGGHCVRQNAELIPDEPFAKYIIERDAAYAKE